MDDQSIIKLFREHSFRATPQRVAVYKYLWNNRCHPDVEEIYNSVKQEYPSFSKTTIYNSLEALEKEGLISTVKVDSQRTHYDAETQLHGHFMCEKCKKIYDFGIENIVGDSIENFDIKHKDVYYSGICPECK